MVRDQAAIGRILGGLCLLALPMGCAYPQLGRPAAVTAAFDLPAETWLGRRVLGDQRAHPEESGLYVLGHGLDSFAARIGLIEHAERAIDLAVYIFHDDVTGRVMLGRLLDAADRGVRVRLLLDDLGSAGLDDLLAAADTHPDLEVRLFNPFARGPLPGLARFLDMLFRPIRLNHRMHNKLLTADGAAAIVGGRNVGDEYFDAREDVNFADLDLLAVGPVVGELGRDFDLYWNSPFAVPLTAWSSLRRGPDELDRLRAELVEHARVQSGSRYAERLRGSDILEEVAAGGLELVRAPAHAIADLPHKIVASRDELPETLLTERLRGQLLQATSELLVVSPYFVPQTRGVEHLTGLAAQGSPCAC